MTPSDLLRRIDDRFRLRHSNDRGGLDRHRTLLATLDWSYNLLAPGEKALFDRLGVFSASFDVAAVEAICADGIDPLDVIELLASLVDKSVVVAERSPAGMRYRLLETVRHYAESHATEQRKLSELRDRHLHHYVELAETAFAGWLLDYTSGKVVFDREWDNLRTATEHALRTGDAASLERLLLPLQWHGLYMLRFEVLDWATDAADLVDAGPATFGAIALLGGFLGRFADAERYARAGIAAAPDPQGPATFTCWLSLGFSLIGQGRLEGAVHFFDVARQTGGLGDVGEAIASAVVAGYVTEIGPAVADDCARRAEALIAGRRNPALSADVLSNLAVYHTLAGDPARGLQYSREALALARTHDARISVHTAHALFAQIVPMGALDDPTEVLCEAIADAYRDRVWLEVWYMVVALATWCATHDVEAAAVVTGHLDAHHVGGGHHAIDETRATVMAQPDADRWLAHGSQLDRDQLVAYILDRYEASR